MNVAGSLYGPCHGILHTALLNKRWLYSRDLAHSTCLPSHVVESALAQMVQANLVEYDSTLKRYKLKHISEKDACRLQRKENGQSLAVGLKD